MQDQRPIWKPISKDRTADHSAQEWWSTPEDLEHIGSRLAEKDLPFFGVRRKPEREDVSEYFVFQGTPQSLDLKASGLVVTFDTDSGLRVQATAPRFSAEKMGRKCSVILATHPAAPGAWLWHR